MEDAEIQRQHGKHENMKQHPKKPVRGHRWNCNNRTGKDEKAIVKDDKKT
jgi:hypothetical protein